MHDIDLYLPRRTGGLGQGILDKTTTEVPFSHAENEELGIRGFDNNSSNSPENQTSKALFLVSRSAMDGLFKHCHQICRI